MQKAHAQPLFKRRERLARGLRTDALGRRRTPDAAKFNGLREGLNCAKFANGHAVLPNIVSGQYQHVLATGSRLGPLVA